MAALLPDEGMRTTRLDSLIMSAAQYILHAGDSTYNEYIRALPSPTGKEEWSGAKGMTRPEVWRRWGDRLSEIADALDGKGELDFKLFDKNREALKDMVIKARDKMVSLAPELFAQSQK